MSSSHKQHHKYGRKLAPALSALAMAIAAATSVQAQSNGDGARPEEIVIVTSRNRQEIGVSGKDVESGHLLPQAVGKKVVGYNADHALTRLLKKSTHASMDAPWKADFKAMRAAGKTTATAQEVFDTVANAIQKAPEIEPGEKMSLIAALTDEMFMQHGLKPDDLLDLPYPNIKAKSAK